MLELMLVELVILLAVEAALIALAELIPEALVVMEVAARVETLLAQQELQTQAAEAEAQLAAGMADQVL